MFHIPNRFPWSLLKIHTFLNSLENWKSVVQEIVDSNLKYFSFFFKVGLDIQQTYTAFYLTPRTVGSKVVINKLKAESSLDTSCVTAQNLPAAKVDSGKQ